MSTAKPLWKVSQEKYLAAHASQVEKGQAEYGTPLTAFNCRDAADDCRREIADALDYLTQLEVECVYWKSQADYWKSLYYQAIDGPENDEEETKS